MRRVETAVPGSRYQKRRVTDSATLRDPPTIDYRYGRQMTLPFSVIQL